jgi:hypothetical protein
LRYPTPAQGSWHRLHLDADFKIVCRVKSSPVIARGISIVAREGKEIDVLLLVFM